MSNEIAGSKQSSVLRDKTVQRDKLLRLIVAMPVLLLVSIGGFLAFQQKTEKIARGGDYPNFRVEFFDDHSGVIIGPRVLHTKDSGSTWSIIDYVRPSDSFKAKDGPKPAKHLIDFIDTDWAWRVSPIDPESVEYTRDGGRSWSEPIGTGVKERSSIAFVTREVGWVFGEKTVVTRDGGKSWQLETALSNLRLDTPYFLDRQNGWVANYWGVIGHTTDGGQHWNILRSPLKQIRSLFFLDPQNGWAVGDDGLVASTENGGADWTIRDAQVPLDSYRTLRTELLDVFFLTRDLGWIVGERGLILKTIDGGKNWARAESLLSAPLASVRFIDALHGWAVGGNAASSIVPTPPTNIVLETSDGGQSWRRKTF
jgi:photosystem II stability/assembly factor-like uncharacterized protein